MKWKNKIKIILIISFLVSSFISFIYYFDEIILPSVMVICNGEMRARAVEVINTSVVEKYIEEFNYDEVIDIEKDEKGNITLLKADTLKMNKISTELSLQIQKKLSDIGTEKVEFNMGYITKNNILANFGPKITAKMQPLGYVESKYISDFESAGINQVRHKIYVEVKAKILVILPMASDEIEVVTQVPIAETVIVGRIPETSIQMDLNK